MTYPWEYPDHPAKAWSAQDYQNWAASLPANQQPLSKYRVKVDSGNHGTLMSEADAQRELKWRQDRYDRYMLLNPVPPLSLPGATVEQVLP